ncbi:hypothetical protein LCGC14_2453610 [marine sediment metagenome]|uniref:Uncharacterized protein n=1 Tax=marine sediment metagenome TaxID=412755 RepID=A0A0F9C2Y9_9ZZZZ
MRNKKDQILLAKKIHPELFDEMSEEMQKQIKQLWEPISQDDAGDAPDRWSKLTDRLEKAEALATDRLKLLRRCYLFLEHAPEFPMHLLADAEELQHELKAYAHEQHT